MESSSETLGSRFARALSAKDTDALMDLIHPEVDFRGLTPSREWEASDPEALLGVLFDAWFEDKDSIEGVEYLDSETVIDRERVGYRFRIRNPDGEFLVEQHAYLAERDGQIGWMRVVCSGFRPALKPPV